MSNNSFKDLEQEENKKNTESFPEDNIKMGLQADLGGMRSIGNTFEFFFSKIVGLIVALAGGNADSKKNQDSSK